MPKFGLRRKTTDQFQSMGGDCWGDDDDSYGDQERLLAGGSDEGMDDDYEDGGAAGTSSNNGGGGAKAKKSSSSSMFKRMFMGGNRSTSSKQTTIAAAEKQQLERHEQDQHVQLETLGFGEGQQQQQQQQSQASSSSIDDNDFVTPFSALPEFKQRAASPTIFSETAASSALDRTPPESPESPPGTKKQPDKISPQPKDNDAPPRSQSTPTRLRRQGRRRSFLGGRMRTDPKEEGEEEDGNDRDENDWEDVNNGKDSNPKEKSDDKNTSKKRSSGKKEKETKSSSKKEKESTSAKKEKERSSSKKEKESTSSTKKDKDKKVKESSSKKDKDKKDSKKEKKVSKDRMSRRASLKNLFMGDNGEEAWDHEHHGGGEDEGTIEEESKKNKPSRQKASRRSSLRDMFLGGAGAREDIQPDPNDQEEALRVFSPRPREHRGEPHPVAPAPGGGIVNAGAFRFARRSSLSAAANRHMEGLTVLAPEPHAHGRTTTMMMSRRASLDNSGLYNNISNYGRRRASLDNSGLYSSNNNNNQALVVVAPPPPPPPEAVTSPGGSSARRSKSHAADAKPKSPRSPQRTKSHDNDDKNNAHPKSPCSPPKCGRRKPKVDGLSDSIQKFHQILESRFKAAGQSGLLAPLVPLVESEEQDTRSENGGVDQPPRHHAENKDGGGHSRGGKNVPRRSFKSRPRSNSTDGVFLVDEKTSKPTSSSSSKTRRGGSKDKDKEQPTSSESLPAEQVPRSPKSPKRSGRRTRSGKVRSKSLGHVDIEKQLMELAGKPKPAKAKHGYGGSKQLARQVGKPPLSDREDGEAIHAAAAAADNENIVARSSFAQLSFHPVAGEDAAVLDVQYEDMLEKLSPL